MERNTENKRLMGYKDLGETAINCSNCGCPLVYIQKVKNSTKQTKIIAECPYCNDTSFETLVLGEFYIGPTEFVQHNNVDTEFNDGFFIAHIETNKGTERYET